MKKLLISKIDNYIYHLIDDNQKTFILNLEFIENKPKVNDYLFLAEELLQEKNFYTFGLLNENELANIKHKDIVKVISNDVTTYYQKYYG